MSNLNDIINLAKADGGKFFVMDETGEAKLVILSLEDYQKLLLGKLHRQVKEQTEDIDKINRIITKAQLQEQEAPAPVDIPKTKFAGPKIMQEMPAPIPRRDLRAEVIDPSFDFEGPKVDIDDL